MLPFLFSIDQCLAKWMTSLPPALIFMAHSMAFLAEPAFHSLFWPCLALLLRRPPFIHLGIATFLSGSAVTCIKILVGRSRPSLFLEKEIFTWMPWTFHHHYHSFPSGHAAISFAIASSLAIQFPKWSVAFFCIATLLSLCRLLLGLHYLTDILGGAVLAFCLTCSINYIGTIWKKNIQTTRSTPSS